MHMPLWSNDKRIGSVVLIAREKGKYSERHAYLISLLMEPFSIAMSNNLKHREILTLKDLLADDNRFLHEELRRLSGNEIVGANGAIETLMDYQWPGNVRELENIVERTLILDRRGPLHFDHLKADQREGYGHLPEEPDDFVNLDEVDIRHIRKILDRTEGKIHGPGGAADLLGINASTLRNRMKKLGIAYRGRGK